MRLIQLLLATVGSIGISSLLPTGASAIDRDLATEAEEACRVALEADTIQALEEYLNKYPRASTACRALATEALSDFSPGGDGAGSPFGPNSGPGYSG